MYIGSNVTVMVSDLDRALTWYTETLGFRLDYRAESEWAEVSVAGMKIGLHQSGPRGPQPGRSESLSIGLQVADFEGSIELLRGRGVAFEGEPVVDGPVRLAFLKDPDGNPLYLCQAVGGG